MFVKFSHLYIYLMCVIVRRLERVDCNTVGWPEHNRGSFAEVSIKPANDNNSPVLFSSEERYFPFRHFTTRTFKDKAKYGGQPSFSKASHSKHHKAKPSSNFNALRKKSAPEPAPARASTTRNITINKVVKNLYNRPAYADYLPLKPYKLPNRNHTNDTTNFHSNPNLLQIFKPFRDDKNRKHNFLNPKTVDAILNATPICPSDSLKSTSATKSSQTALTLCGNKVNSTNILMPAEGRKVKHYKKYRKFLIPLLLAYKLKFLTLIPVLIAGLTLLVGVTGLAGFFFALFTATMSMKMHHGKSIVIKEL